jgi:lipoprotein-anchoring transpeptidase ErfK/SrfK
MFRMERSEMPFSKSGVMFESSAAAIAVVFGAMLLALAGCADPIEPAPMMDAPNVLYGSVEDDGFTVAAINLETINPQFLRQVVDTPPTIASEPGIVVIDPANRFLYLTLAGGKSMRYGIGVGRDGFAWSGEAVIKDKQHWPKWFPPKEMMERDPEAAKYPDGMDGGPSNPLGARALYLWQGKKDTLYRVHGTRDPSSIGKAVSSGCVRMFNQDIIDLYERVPLDTKVIVLPAENEADALVTEIVGPTVPPKI